MLCQIIFCFSGGLVHYKKIIGISGLYSPGAGSTPIVVTTKNGSSQTLSNIVAEWERRTTKSPSLRTTVLGYQSYCLIKINTVAYYNRCSSIATVSESNLHDSVMPVHFCLITFHLQELFSYSKTKSVNCFPASL